MTAAGNVTGFLPDGRTRLLGIVGDPIAHSLSPALHTVVLRTLERNLIYLPFPVSRGRLPEFLRLAPELGLVGLNVTTPYKETAAGAVRSADLETTCAGMVNTIYFSEGQAFGCGTDGPGILGSLDAWCATGEPIGILGFGPTARSLVCRSMFIGRSIAVILTRRPEEVRAVVTAWKARGPRSGTWAMPEICGWDQTSCWPLNPSRSGESVSSEAPCWPHCWVSTLPPSAADLPPLFWERCPKDGFLLDLNYGPGRTPLRDEARRRGLRAEDGIRPLCHQAALSLSVWLGEDVPVSLYLKAAESAADGLRFSD